MLKPPSARTVYLKPAECYWSVLNAKPFAGLRAEQRRQAMLYTLEQDLPLPIDDVEAVFVDLDDDQIIACACLQSMLTELSEQADVVYPEAIPEWLGIDLVGSSFNLLDGKIRSERIRRMSNFQTVSIVLGCLLLSILLTTGFSVRSNGFAQERQDSLDASAAAMELVLPPAGPNAQPASIRLAALLRSVDSDSSTDIRADYPAATDSLAEVLECWPSEARLTRMSVGKQDIRVDLTMPPDLDPAPFIGNLEDLAGWTLSAPVVRRSAETTSISVSLQRMQGVEG